MDNKRKWDSDSDSEEETVQNPVNHNEGKLHLGVNISTKTINDKRLIVVLERANLESVKVSNTPYTIVLYNVTMLTHCDRAVALRAVGRRCVTQNGLLKR